jgi:hypothetical protein
VPRWSTARLCVVLCRNNRRHSSNLLFTTDCGNLRTGCNISRSRVIAVFRCSSVRSFAAIDAIPAPSSVSKRGQAGDASLDVRPFRSQGVLLFAQFIPLAQAAAQLLRESIRRNFCGCAADVPGGLGINDGRER